jgi:hypothetical protein
MKSTFLVLATVWLLAVRGPGLRGQTRQEIQGKQPLYTPGNPNSNRPFPPGQYTLHPDLSEPVGSLNQLILMSRLIVDGTVITILPTIVRNPNVPGEVETDSIISVHQAISGKAPPGGQILLHEQGGQQGQWQISVAGDPLVQVGEHYILFLAPTAPGNIPNSEGILPDASAVPRYFPIGYANGKAGVNSNGVVQFVAGAIPALHTCDSLDVTSFTGILNDRIAALLPTPLPYPAGVTPLVAQGNSIFPPGVKPLPSPPAGCK